MKNAKPKLKLLVAAALLGMSHTAQAQVPIVPNEEFTPLERLPADERAFYEQQLRGLEGCAISSRGAT